MRKICGVLILLIFPFFVSAQGLPQPAGWVNDFAGVISQDYRDKIEALIAELERKSSAEVMVVTMASIAPYDEKEYARLVFDSWKPGKAGKDNGVLILLAVNQRRWRIETGYGLEGILPDALCGSIGRDYMVPFFKDGRYAEGLYYGVSAIAGVIARDANIELGNLDKALPKRQAQGNSLFLYFFAFIFFLVWNLPWPIFIGLPFTLLFALAFFSTSPLSGVLVILGYIASLIIRYFYWNKLPLDKRKSFFGTQSYGGSYSGGSWGSGGFGGGGFGGGGGGGGGGAGGGAGGGF